MTSKPLLHTYLMLITPTESFKFTFVEGSMVTKQSPGLFDTEPAGPNMENFNPLSVISFVFSKPALRKIVTSLRVETSETAFF